MTCIVIHGFNSAPGRKSKLIQQAFPEAIVHSPKLKGNPIEDLQLLQSILDTSKDVHVVGTSLGAFYAMCLAVKNQSRLDCAYYAINPSICPGDRFRTQLHQTFQNYKTNEVFQITENFIEELSSLQENLLSNFHLLKNIYFFLSMNDEVLEFDTLKNYIDLYLVKYCIIESEQSHRHEDISDVLECMKELTF